MVKNLKSEVGRMMQSGRRFQEASGKAEQQFNALKASADYKENLLKMDNFTDDLSMTQDLSVMPSDVDETVLQKRPSNP